MLNDFLSLLCSLGILFKRNLGSMQGQYGKRKQTPEKSGISLPWNDELDDVNVVILQESVRDRSQQYVPHGK